MVFWILLSNFTYGTGIALSNMVNGSFHYHNLSHFGGEVNLFLYFSPFTKVGFRCKSSLAN